MPHPVTFDFVNGIQLATIIIIIHRPKVLEISGELLVKMFIHKKEEKILEKILSRSGGEKITSLIVIY